MSNQLSEITESINLHGGNVDREKGTISNVKILGRSSVNSREYTEQALKDAAKCYEGVGTNVDHDRSGKERSVSAGNGWISNCEVKPDGVFGTVNLLKSHPLTEQILETAERNPTRIGLSHHAFGRDRKVGGKWIVESVESVKSVDFVQKPATSKGLFESEEPPVSEKKTVKAFIEAIEGDSAEKKSLATLIESNATLGGMEIEEAEFKSPLVAALNAALIESVAKQAKAPEQKPDLTLQNLQKELDAFKARDKATALLESAGVQVTSIRVKALSSLTEKADQDAYLADCKSVQKVPKPSNGGRVLHESAGGDDIELPKDDKDLAKLLRSSR